MLYRVDFYGLEVYVDGNYVGHNDHFVLVECEELDEEAILEGAFEFVREDFHGEAVAYNYYEIQEAIEDDIEEWQQWLDYKASYTSQTDTE